MKRTIAGLVFTTLLMTGAASASSFVTPEPMTAKLGPSMIALGEPASEPAAAATQAEPAEAVAKAIGQAPLEYPFPGGKVPVVRAADRIVGQTPLNYPAPKPSPDGVTFIKVSPSIIAMAAPEPAVSFEEVASVDESGKDEEPSSQSNAFGPGPTVIRGGIIGGSGSTSVSMPALPAKKPAAARQAPAMASTQPAPAQHAAPQAAASPQSPAKEPDQPIPSPTPAPPPADIVPQARIR